MGQVVQALRAAMVPTLSLCCALGIACAEDPGGKVKFLVSPRDTADADIANDVAELFVRLGVPVEPVEVPSGQVTHIIDGPTPACGLSILRTATGREGFRWIAPSFQDSLVIASPHGQPGKGPGAGGYVAGYSAKAIQLAADGLGLKLIPVLSFDQLPAIFRSGRTNFVLLAKMELRGINSKMGLDLAVVQTIQPLITWVACNGSVEQERADAIARAWRRSLQDGTLKRIYARAHLDNGLPDH